MGRNSKDKLEKIKTFTIISPATDKYSAGFSNYSASLTPSSYTTLIVIS